MPIKQGIYQHFKGNYYQVEAIVRHSEDLQEMVLYKALYGDFGLWVRPVQMFQENVQIGDKLLPRFCFIQDITDDFVQPD